MDQLYDYLIAFNAVTCYPERPTDRHLPPNTILIDDSYPTGRIIHIYWATYDVNKKMVLDECEYFVKPSKFTELSPETVQKTRIKNEDMNTQGITLPDAIHRFNEALYLNYISNNASFCLVTNGDNVLKNFLPRDAREAGVKLANHFFSYFDIMEEFRKLYRVHTTFSTLNDCLNFLKLKETQANNLGQVEAKSILRLIHRLTSDGHKFQNPKVLNAMHQIISERNENTSSTGRVHQNKKWSTFIRSRSPENFRNPLKKWFIRVRGLPARAREAEIMLFLKGVRVYKEDIALLYDYEGKFSGEAYIQLHNEPDFKEALSFNLSNLGNRQLEVFETNENEYNKAKLSQYPDKRERNVETVSNWNHLLREDLGILKVRGLPYSCTEEDIRSFFRGFNIVEDGIKRAVIGGKPSGECFVVFTNKDQAFAAMGLNMEKIGNRFVEIFTSTTRELENLLHHGLSNHGPSYSKENMPNIPFDKRKSTLLMTGLPFSVSKPEILKFFGNFSLRDTDVCLIPSHSGKFSGNALITFEDELEAQRAMKTRNLTYIGNRYIELVEYR